MGLLGVYTEIPAIAYFNNETQPMDLSDVRFMEQVDFKGQSVSALLVPRTNAQGILCGETVFALSPDRSTIIGEGSRGAARDGFYLAQRGQGEVLILSDSLLHAKSAALRHPEATVVLARMEDYPKVADYLSAQEINPKKVMVLSNDLCRNKQMLVAEFCQGFDERGAMLFLMDGTEGTTVMKLDAIALEKTRLKMNFEQLLSQKPVAMEVTKKLSAQELFNTLKKEYPILNEYEQLSRERKDAQGYAREQLDKQLLSLAKDIGRDKKLRSLLQRDVPQVFEDIKKRIRLSIQHDRGIHR